MGLFGDLKRFTAASANVVGEGMQALAEGAEALERGAACLNLELQLKRLGMHLETPSLREEGETSASIRADMLRILDELIQKTSAGEKVRWVTEKADISRSVLQERIDSLVATINSLRGRDRTTDYVRPVAGIQAKQQIISQLQSLIALLLDGQNAPLKARSSELVQELQCEVASLENRRNRIVRQSFPDGQKKGLVRLRDGQRHGMSEYWHSNGQRKLCVHFHSGRIDRNIEYFAADASLLLLMSMTKYQGAAQTIVYDQSGNKMLEIYADQRSHPGTGYGDIWLWNKIYAGRAYFSAGKPHAVKFLIGLLFRPSVLFALWKERAEDGRSREAQIYLERFKAGQAAVDEVRAVIDEAPA